MGRPIRKKWFTAKWGSAEGNLQLTVGLSATTEEIIKQVGTGVYEVASGRVKLADPNATGYVAVDPDPLNGVVGTALLTHDGENVRRINQFRLSYFDPVVEDAVWRDGDSNIVGTFAPALTAESNSEPGAPVVPPVVPAQATGTVVMDGAGNDDNGVASVTINDGGAGYLVAPVVTFSAGDGTIPVTATGTAVIVAGVVVSVTIVLGGSYADVTTATITIAAP